MAMDNAGPVIGTAPAPIAADVNYYDQVTAVPGLPNGFPSVLDCPLAWTGLDFFRESDYVLHLSLPDIGELEGALSKFKGASLILTSY
jgi:hypothetical protein